MAPFARRLIAWSSLVALVASLAMPMLPGFHAAATTEDDYLGQPRPNDDFRLEASGAAAKTPVHCVICHWLRTASSATPRPAESPDPALASRRVTAAPPIRSAGQTVDVERPSRAPPVAS